MKKVLLAAMFAALAALPARGQFALYQVSGLAELAMPRTFDYGAVESGASLAVPFRIRNVSAATVTLDFLRVNGSGFSLASVTPALPANLAPQQSVDFSVVFQSAGAGSYTASLDSIGFSVLLTATVPAELICQLDTGGGTRPLAAAPVDFGNVERGAPAVRHIILLNQTSGPLPVPAPQAAGGDFALTGPSPGGTILAPGASVTFDVQFNPASDGAQTGALHIGARTYSLIGTGVEPALPAPHLSISLAQTASAQQGSISVNLESASGGAGSGSVTLNFTPAAQPLAIPADTAIAFASGGQSANFTVSPGDTQGHFGSQTSLPFQTGTTAGTLTVAVQLNGNGDRQSVTIAAAPVGITAVAGTRQSGAVEVDLTGFDNTRSAGALAFTFYDAAGDTIGPGAIRSDASTGFQSYFQGVAGGGFSLKAVFPVAGDATRIRTFDVTLTNAAGPASTARTVF